MENLTGACEAEAGRCSREMNRGMFYNCFLFLHMQYNNSRIRNKIKIIVEEK